MKSLIPALVLLALAAARGSEQDYFSARRWVERQCSTNASPPDQRLYVGRARSPVYADIVLFREGLTLREIVDRSPLKGRSVKVCVMRPHTIPKSGSNSTRREYINMKSSDAPVYELKRSDVIWLYDEGMTVVR